MHWRVGHGGLGEVEAMEWSLAGAPPTPHPTPAPGTEHLLSPKRAPLAPASCPCVITTMANTLVMSHFGSPPHRLPITVKYESGEFSVTNAWLTEPLFRHPVSALVAHSRLSHSSQTVTDSASCSDCQGSLPLRHGLVTGAPAWLLPGLWAPPVLPNGSGHESPSLPTALPVKVSWFDGGGELPSWDRPAPFVLCPCSRRCTFE